MRPNLIHLTNQKQFRIIPSVYPPINFFEELVDPSEMDTLWEIENMTNERLREETGEIFLVSPQDRISGPGSSIVMATFTHLTKATRFSNGSYGVYYAGLSKETAIRETVYHREIFLSTTAEPSCEITMRLYEGKILKPLHDITGKKFKALHHTDNYTLSQRFGQQLREKQSWGLVYNSVRHPLGTCIAAFRPPAISIPKQTSHLKYLWDGKRITEVFHIHSILELA